MACCTAASEIGYGKTRRISFVDSDVSSEVTYQISSKTARRMERVEGCGNLGVEQ